MKLKVYLKKLNKLTQKNPEYLNLDVIYSIDDEGNGFNEVLESQIFNVLHFDKKDYYDQIKEGKKPNAICIN